MSADNVTPITTAYLERLDAGLLAGLRASIGFRTTYLPITPEELAAVFRAIDERDELKAAADSLVTSAFEVGQLAERRRIYALREAARDEALPLARGIDPELMREKPGNARRGCQDVSAGGLICIRRMGHSIDDLGHVWATSA